MATRRKYKVRREPELDAVNVVAVQPAATMTSTDDANPLRRAHDAAVHAEELQRQQHAARQQPPQPAYHGAVMTDEQQQQIAAHIDGLPISDHKKNFLRRYPQLMVAPLNQVMAHHYQLALHAGVPDDTEAMNQAVLEGVDHDIQRHQRMMAAHAQPSQGLAQAHLDPDGAANELAREAASHLAANAPPAAPTRRSIPMSAPVSRDVPMASGQRRPGQITLSRDEREIAHSSFKHLSKDQAELAYSRNKRLMHQRKADGSIQGDQ